MRKIRVAAGKVVATGVLKENTTAGVDAILPCHTDRFSAQVIERLPKTVRIMWELDR